VPFGNATDAGWLQVGIGGSDGVVPPARAWRSTFPGRHWTCPPASLIGHHRAMTDAATDPIQSPDGYRNMLLGYLSDDDPAKVQAATVARLRELVAEAGADLRIRPEPKEWSVIECIGHLTDSEVVTSARVRWILAEDEPQIIGYDQDLWVDGLRHDRDDPGALIALFDALRSANLTLLSTRSAADLERFGQHNERGPESYGLMIRLTAGHDRFHVAQAERALAAVREASQAAVEPR